jgi:phospholipid N-methyltransferase
MKIKGWKKEQRLFISSALKGYKEIGMLFPSSHKSAQSVISLIPIEKMNKIIEVGSGTGRMTRVIQNHLSPGAQLFCVEKNPDFCAYLEETFPTSNVVIINEHFENLLKIHPDIDVSLVDCVILSLPAALSPVAMRQLWLDLAHSVLVNGGYLLIHQFIPVMRQYLRNSHWVRKKRKWVIGLPPYCFEVYQKI